MIHLLKRTRAAAVWRGLNQTVEMCGRNAAHKPTKNKADFKPFLGEFAARFNNILYKVAAKIE